MRLAKTIGLLLACLSCIASASQQDELGKAFPNKVTSKYFKFYSDISLDRVQMYATFSDQFVDLVNRDFFKLQNRFPLNAYVLSNKAAFQRFLSEKFNVQRPPDYGMYLSGPNAFVTYDGSGLGTFTHEIAHALVEESLKNRPSWAMEGIPSFFEKFFGYSKDGRLYVHWGYQNPWRVELLGDKLVNLKLIRVIYGSEDTSEKRLLSVFLYQQGKLRAYLDLIQSGNKKDYRTYEEAVFDKPMYQLEVIWEAYLKEIAANKPKILRIPNSAIFSNEGDMKQFMEQYGLASGALPL